MPTCHRCGGSHETADLVRHERARLVLVHCPDCECLMGRYRRHGDAPATDALREGRRD
jgi:uncharacterized Zn finger protein